MNVREISRTAIIVAIGFFFGCLFSQSLIYYNGKKKLGKDSLTIIGNLFLEARKLIQPSIKPAKKLKTNQTTQQPKTSNNLDNSSFKIDLSDFSKIKKQMR